MPTVPHWARAASAVFGLPLLIPFLLTILDGRTDQGAQRSTPGRRHRDRQLLAHQRGERAHPAGLHLRRRTRPADENVDSEDENENRVLAPGETVEAAGRVFLDSAGTWPMFPCYALPGDDYCPDEWQAFNVIAE